MKKIALTIFVCTLFMSAPYIQGGTVIVEISGIKKVKGDIVIGLYNKQKGFPEVGKQYKGIISKIQAKKATYKFENIPDGNYAVALFQDLNKNGKMDYNFLGIPKEPYAFSCIERTCLKTPGFHEAKFKLKEKCTLKLKLK